MPKATRAWWLGCHKVTCAAHEPAVVTGWSYCILCRTFRGILWCRWLRHVSVPATHAAALSSAVTHATIWFAKLSSGASIASARLM